MNKCDQCQLPVDLNEEGGFIYPDGLVICPSCEGGGEVCGDHLMPIEDCGCKL